ncbi:MAG: SPOR domain-containing protein, partial [Burkholderiales bacterium]|nr:SPOR domain-containing protein [Burkholderiales bacterium]
MFKPRSAAASATPPSVELVRQRAKHRLMGVSVLVLAAVVLFPLLFDTQPRPIPVDIPIEIPSRKTAKPLTVEPAPEPTVELSTAAAKPADAKAPVKTEGVARAVADDEEVIISHTPARAPVKPLPAKSDAVKPESAPAKEAAGAPMKEGVKEALKEPAKAAPPKETHKEPAKEPAKEAPKPAAVKEVAKEPVKDPVKEPIKDAAVDAARAQALLEGKAPPAAAKPAAAADVPGARYIVQVGAFADSAVAQSARLKLERAGIKTYTHVIETPEGKRIRVRVGPFDGKAEAEKAAARIKGLNLPVSILL